MKVRAMTIKEVAEEMNITQQHARVGIQVGKFTFRNSNKNATEVRNIYIRFQQKNFLQKGIDQYQVNT